ncbi:MAG: DUF11 domain-containing protein [Candidatus Competibacteraceae bacterium]|nr:DUF11 domain-containing protein [Candidatus Competibacteraceae bacterium]
MNGGNDAAALDSTGAALTTDARGTGFARINGAAVDIGAYELQGCNSVTVTSRSELNAAISDFNSNCANGDTLTATVDGTISMTSSLTTLNNATDAVLLVEGGTIDANDSASVMRLNNGKAVFQNMTLKNANGLNGGTFFVDSNGDLTLINSTISNSIATTGGAIAIQNGVLTLTNTTISDTTRLTNGGAVVSLGGTMNLNNTIIANTVDNSANPVEDCVNSGGVVNFSAGLSNLIEDDVACGTAGTDFIEADPLLGTLADNGGKVETMILLPGSPAVNIGDNTAASGLTTDARGVGFPRILNGTVDLGATENEDLTSPALLTLDPADDSVNVVLTPTLRITLNETIQAGIGNITIKRVSDDGVAATFDVMTDVSFTTDTAEFTVPTALDDATEYYVSIPAGAITDSNGNAFAGFTDNATWSFTTRSFAADLSISKTDSADPVLAGSTLIYTLTVNNAGPDTAENVVVTDNLPTGVTLVSTSGCAEDPNGVTTCSLGDIASGGSAQYTIEVTVDAGTEGVITNNASVTADTGDLTPSNNSASEETTATPPPTGSLTLVKEADPEDGTDFAFTSDIPDGSTFSLDDEPSQSDVINQSITFADLPVGTYAITETLPSDWALDSTSCTGASGSTSLSGETLTVPVGAGEVITCTFNNTKQDSNIILKDVFE